MTRVIPSAARNLAFALTAALPLTGPAQAADPLWDKAVAIAGANKNWKAGLVTSRSEELDDDERVTKTREQTLRFTAGPDGAERIEIVKVVEDGKDITAAQQAEFEKARKKTGAKELVNLGFEPLGPFDPAAQEAVTVTRLDEARDVGGKACVPFRYVQKLAEKTVKGTTCLDRNSGAPLEVTSTEDPLPSFVRDMRVIVKYATRPDGAWYPAESAMAATGGILFVKKRLRNVMTFSEYRRAPEK